MNLQTGQILQQRYRIVRLLSQGDSGSSYRAWDLALNIPCIVQQNLHTSDPQAQHQFEREATRLARLRHPGLPRITDHFTIPDAGQYLVIDFVEGEDLQTKLNLTQRPLPEAQLLPWIKQICQVLAYLHSQNPPIIHQNVSPNSIRITPQGQAVLVNYTITKQTEPSSQTSMSDMDTSSDIYALGATLYQTLTGEIPPERSQRLVRDSLLAPHKLNLAITPHLESVILKAMSLHSEGGYFQVSEMAMALSQGSIENNDLPTIAMPSLPVIPSPGAQSRSGQLPRWTWVAGGILLILVLGLLAAMIVLWRENATTVEPLSPTIAVTITPLPTLPASTVVSPTNSPILANDTPSPTNVPATSTPLIIFSHTSTPTRRATTIIPVAKTPATPTPTYTPTPEPTLTSTATRRPVTPTPDVRTALLSVMKSVQSDIGSFGGLIDTAVRVGYINCNTVIATYDRIVNAQRFDTSASSGNVKQAHTSYEAAINTFAAGTRDMTANCRNPGGSIPFQQWGVARQNVNNALDILNPAIERLE